MPLHFLQKTTERDTLRMFSSSLAKQSATPLAACVASPTCSFYDKLIQAPGVCNSLETPLLLGRSGWETTWATRQGLFLFLEALSPGWLWVWVWCLWREEFASLQGTNSLQSPSSCVRGFICSPVFQIVALKYKRLKNLTLSIRLNLVLMQGLTLLLCC